MITVIIIIIIIHHHHHHHYHIYISLNNVYVEGSSISFLGQVGSQTDPDLVARARGPTSSWARGPVGGRCVNGPRFGGTSSWAQELVGPWARGRSVLDRTQIWWHELVGLGS